VAGEAGASLRQNSLNACVTVLPAR
jgi:hypothetical protein